MSQSVASAAIAENAIRPVTTSETPKMSDAEAIDNTKDYGYTTTAEGTNAEEEEDVYTITIDGNAYTESNVEELRHNFKTFFQLCTGLRFKFVLSCDKFDTGQHGLF